MTADWIDAGAESTRLPAPADTRLAKRAADAARSLAASAKRVAPVLARCRDSAPGHPQAASYDRPIVSGSSSHLWCFAHERGIRDCEASGLGCDGTPVTVHDPTGEAAMRPDADAAALSRIRALVSKAEHAARDLAAELEALTAIRPPSGAERERDADPGCESCARVASSAGPRWEPVYREANPGGNLDRRWRLCSWCWRWAVDTGRLPTQAEAAAHHAGKRMTRPA